MKILSLPPFSSCLTQLAQPWLAAQAVHCTSLGMPFTRLQCDDPGVTHYGAPEAQTLSLPSVGDPVGQFLEGTSHKS